jgi:hypothetical protein
MGTKGCGSLAHAKLEGEAKTYSGARGRGGAPEPTAKAPGRTRGISPGVGRPRAPARPGGRPSCAAGRAAASGAGVGGFGAAAGAALADVEPESSARVFPSERVARKPSMTVRTRPMPSSVNQPGVAGSPGPASSAGSPRYSWWWSAWLPPPA